MGTRTFPRKLRVPIFRNESGRHAREHDGRGGATAMENRVRHRSAGARAARTRKSRRREGPRRLIDLLQLQFCSVTKSYPGSVTLSICFYHTGYFLQNHRASRLKTAISAARL
jgi:hypothetical protein